MVKVLCRGYFLAYFLTITREYGYSNPFLRNLDPKQGVFERPSFAIFRFSVLICPLFQSPFIVFSTKLHIKFYTQKFQQNTKKCLLFGCIFSTSYTVSSLQAQVIVVASKGNFFHLIFVRTTHFGKGIRNNCFETSLHHYPLHSFFSLLY